MTKIFVGNLSFRTTEESLRTAFASFGEVTQVSLPTDRVTGKPRGFAFVEMPDKTQAEDAIGTLHESELDGRSLNVNEAKATSKFGVL